MNSSTDNVTVALHSSNNINDNIHDIDGIIDGIDGIDDIILLQYDKGCVKVIILFQQSAVMYMCIDAIDVLFMY